jgi:hypothetical protein
MPLFDARSMARLSGVVHRMAGGEAAMLRRSDCGVSPEREDTLTLGNASPFDANQDDSSLRGPTRLTLTSSLSALSGDT